MCAIWYQPSGEQSTQGRFFSFCRLRFGAWAVVKNVTWHVRDQEAEKLREQAKCPISQRAAKQGTHKGK
jgi:hypothetical protein